MSARLPASGRGRLSLACYPARRRAQQRRQARARPSRRAISSWGSPMDQAKTPLLNSEAIEARKSIARGTFLVCDMDCADPGCDGGARATRARSVGAAQIGRHTSELQSLMRISYAVFCLKKKK